jgi:hypothetical protein
MTENQIKKIVSSVKCHACGEHYEKNSIEILGHENDTWFMNVFCSKCKKSIFIAAIIKKEEAQLSTDLTQQEISRLSGNNPVSDDDLLGLHKFLTDFDGDFAKLFNQG